ncbi:MAG: hypothetical protein M3Y73_17920 [Actinomycetota bacterium]|nr:hypothetical protein [Actinomycetota bacterium]
MFTVGWGGSRGRVVRVVLATLGLVAAVAIWSPAHSRADARSPVLLVHGGFLGSPANFSKMIERLRADHYDPYTVDLGLVGNDTAANAKKISADQCPNGEFLQTLNRGDDTLGSIRYTSIASKQEPDEADGTLTRLDHGACLPLVDGGPHGDEPNNLVIYQAVNDGLNSTCPSGWTDLSDITP